MRAIRTYCRCIDISVAWICRRCSRTDVTKVGKHWRHEQNAVHRHRNTANNQPFVPSTLRQCMGRPDSACRLSCCTAVRWGIEIKFRVQSCILTRRFTTGECSTTTICPCGAFVEPDESKHLIRKTHAALCLVARVTRLNGALY